jgi:hypothetical protein
LISSIGVILKDWLAIHDKLDVLLI